MLTSPYLMFGQSIMEKYAGMTSRINPLSLLFLAQGEPDEEAPAGTRAIQNRNTFYQTSYHFYNNIVNRYFHNYNDTISLILENPLYRSSPNFEGGMAPVNMSYIAAAAAEELVRTPDGDRPGTQEETARRIRQILKEEIKGLSGQPTAEVLESTARELTERLVLLEKENGKSEKIQQQISSIVREKTTELLQIQIHTSIRNLVEQTLNDKAGKLSAQVAEFLTERVEEQVRAELLHKTEALRAGIAEAGREAQAAKGREAQAAKGREAQAAKDREAQAAKGREAQAAKDREAQAAKDRELQAAEVLQEKLQYVVGKALREASGESIRALPERTILSVAGEIAKAAGGQRGSIRILMGETEGLAGRIAGKIGGLYKDQGPSREGEELSLLQKVLEKHLEPYAAAAGRGTSRALLRRQLTTAVSRTLQRQETRSVLEQFRESKTAQERERLLGIVIGRTVDELENAARGKERFERQVTGRLTPLPVRPLSLSYRTDSQTQESGQTDVLQRRIIQVFRDVQTTEKRYYTHPIRRFLEQMGQQAAVPNRSKAPAGIIYYQKPAAGVRFEGKDVLHLPGELGLPAAALRYRDGSAAGPAVELKYRDGAAGLPALELRYRDESAAGPGEGHVPGGPRRPGEPVREERPREAEIFSEPEIYGRRRQRRRTPDFTDRGEGEALRQEAGRASQTRLVFQTDTGFQGVVGLHPSAEGAPEFFNYVTGLLREQKGREEVPLEHILTAFPASNEPVSGDRSVLADGLVSGDRSVLADVLASVDGSVSSDSFIPVSRPVRLEQEAPGHSREMPLAAAHPVELIHRQEPKTEEPEDEQKESPEPEQEDIFFTREYKSQSVTGTDPEQPRTVGGQSGAVTRKEVQELVQGQVEERLGQYMDESISEISRKVYKSLERQLARERERRGM